MFDYQAFKIRRIEKSYRNQFIGKRLYRGKYNFFKKKMWTKKED